MKRLLNDPMMNDTRWPDYNKKVKQKTDLQSDNRETGLKWHLSCYWHRNLNALSQWPYFDCLTYVGPIYNGPIYKAQAKCFSLRNLSRFLNKSVVNQLQTALAKRLQRTKSGYINYQPSK